MSANENGRARLHWEGEEEDERAARRAAAARADLVAGTIGEPFTLGNEFSEIRISRVATRNGARLLIESTRSGQWVALCPLELEALTWQNTDTFAAMIGNPFGPLLADGDENEAGDGNGDEAGSGSGDDAGAGARTGADEDAGGAR